MSEPDQRRLMEFAFPRQAGVARLRPREERPQRAHRHVSRRRPACRPPHPNPLLAGARAVSGFRRPADREGTGIFTSPLRREVGRRPGEGEIQASESAFCRPEPGAVRCDTPIPDHCGYKTVFVIPRNRTRWAAFARHDEVRLGAGRIGSLPDRLPLIRRSCSDDNRMRQCRRSLPVSAPFGASIASTQQRGQDVGPS